MKKIIFLSIITAIALCAIPTAASAAFGGAGVTAIASGVSVVKSGLRGEQMRFSEADFKSALGIADFDKLTVLTLPSSTEGTLMLGTKRVGEGDVIKRRNIPYLTFEPATNDITQSCFTVSVDRGSEAKISCTLYFLDAVNYEPVIGSDTEESLTVTTQTGISVWGNLKASDPEGDTLSYQIISYPEYGMLKVYDGGEFRYTPTGAGDCYDSFTFTVRDRWGNYAKPATVKIRVTERMSEIVFADMTESKSYNAAVAMSAMGIMSGSRLGDDMYFNPTGTVTRAEFVAMAMKALSIKPDSTLTRTYFDDNAAIPSSLVSYVATAARCGIVNGAFDGKELNFRPTDPITVTEAAIIMSNMINLRSDSSVFSEIDGIYTVPVWAREEVGAMYEAGIFDTGEHSDLKSYVTREQAAEYLYRLMQR